MLLLLLLFSWAAQASPTPYGNSSTQQFTFSEITPSTSLIWHPCNITFFCAILDVPLDYSKPNGTRATIPLLMIPAESNSTEDSYKGMLLTNPGGPGETGVDFLFDSGYPTLKPVIGPNYDIVSFDPRGTGRSTPLADCQLGETSPISNLRRRAFGLQGPELTRQDFWNTTFEQAQALGSACAATIGADTDAGPHMSTAVVAQDMLSIVDAFSVTQKGQALKSSNLLNYWGLSAGTLLGQTFASMYPDRVGRLAIDGVSDPVDYFSGQDLDDIEWDDAIVNSFFTYCHLAGPSLCSFYTGSTPADIYLRFQSIFDQLNASFALDQNWDNATTIDQSLSIVKSAIRLNLYDPMTRFPAMASQLVAFENDLKNLTVAGITASRNIGSNLTHSNLDGLEEWLPAIVCSESPSIINETFADLETFIQTLENQSFIAGETWSSFIATCTGWSIRATSIYDGPFGGKTKNPILFISNSFDPATPIKNSHNWVPKFEGAQLLTIEAIGHTSIVLNNACANSKIRAFFEDGKLPGNDAFCPTEAGAFGITIANLSSIIITPTTS